MAGTYQLFISLSTELHSIDFVANITFFFIEGEPTCQCPATRWTNWNVLKSNSRSSQPQCTDGCHNFPNFKRWSLFRSQEVVLCWKPSSITGNIVFLMRIIFKVFLWNRNHPLFTLFIPKLENCNPNLPVFISVLLYIHSNWFAFEISFIFL